MPSKTLKQHKFMEAIAHNPAFAKKVGVSQSVGKDFSEADKGKRFGAGGAARPDAEKVNKSKTDHGKMALFNKGGDTMATKGVNPFAKFEKSGKDLEKKGMKEGSKADMMLDKKQMAMKKGGMTKMAMGGMNSHKMPDGSMMAGKMKHGGMTKMKHGGTTKMATGGGIESKGKTKGTMVKMAKGGKYC